MTEGQGATAAAAREQGAGNGAPAGPPPPAAAPPPASPPPPALSPHRFAPPPPARPARARRWSIGPAAEPAARVNARLIESAILALRKPIVAAQLPLEAPGIEEARTERRKLLGQIDDYLLPRLRESASPILVALVGSTGAGKSTLVNSIVGAQVSMTGIRRPTTNSPVLACHPEDIGWFAENVFLPTVPRVRQEGLARSGRDGLLVLAASEGMPKGVALLDTPDIDSVVQAHRDFAHQFLDASDMWLFMTTATRYADAAVWDLLQHARDRGAALGVVLSRVNAESAPELIDHFGAMLEANGLSQHQRFLILETVLRDGKWLPPEASTPIRRWLAEATLSDRRVAVLTQTMSGMLDTFPVRVPMLAAHVEAQAALRDKLVAAVTGAYRAAMAEVETATADGSLLSGEVLARWQDFAGTGELLRSLQPRRSVGKQRRRRGPARAQTLRSAVRTALESLLISAAGRAAEESVSRWRDQPAGAALLDKLAGGEDGDDWSGSQFAVDAGLILGLDPGATGDGAGDADRPEQAAAALGRASPDLGTRAARAVSSWQEQVLRVVKAEKVTKRSISKIINFDDESLATVLMVGLLVSNAPDAGDEQGTTAIPQRLLTSLFGAGPLRDIARWARADLLDRIGLIFDEEMLRFSKILGQTDVPDAGAALQLYQATYALEVTR
ncbi:MAG TPA: GTPase [Streptosporangiaceae bacterium]|nr:GTPase [Streptosporangiaceae bacterium]